MTTEYETRLRSLIVLPDGAEIFSPAATMKRVEGPPLELKIVPLYAAIAKGEKAP